MSHYSLSVHLLKVTAVQRKSLDGLDELEWARLLPGLCLIVMAQSLGTQAIHIADHNGSKHWQIFAL